MAACSRGILQLWLLLFLGGAVIASGQIRTAVELRSLPADQAEAEVPVELQGVVVFVDAPTTVFFQDATAGSFFRLEGRESPQPGDEVRVRGVSHRGLYLPGIRRTEFEVLGHPGLPEGIPAGFEDLISGRYHYQRVAVEGIVRTIAPEGESSSVLRLDLGSRVVAVRVGASPEPTQDLIDARVRVLGLAAGELNHRRQLVEPYLRCSGWEDISTLVPARQPEAIAEVSPEEILNFAVGGALRHRVRLVGRVLASFEGGEVFLRNGDAGIGVRLLESEAMPGWGETIEVLGFPEMHRFSAWLVDASLIQRSPSPPGDAPLPLPVSLVDLLNGRHDSDLVELEADLADLHRSDHGGVLTLRDGNDSLRAELAVFPVDWEVGSRLRVTGIALVESARRSGDYRASPERVVLRLRDPADVAVLRAPSWWTPRRLATALVIFLIATVLAGLWIALLRRQVALQTAALRHRIEHEAILEERQRLAREFHDTLEQQLAGLFLRLDAAVARGQDESLRGFLDESRKLVSRIQTETRNLVSDLRQHPDDAADLEGALRDLVAQGTNGAGPKLELDWPAEGLPTLPSRSVHHLRMVAQEAVTNAIKHAEPRRVVLSLAMTEAGLRMSIRDDGRGFDAERETGGSSPKPGHFGCMGMRERCRKIGADLVWKSSPGEGTEVILTLPKHQIHDTPR